MSWRATAAVKGLADNLTAREKLVLFLLSDHHNEHTGQCNPGKKALAAQAMSSQRHLQRVLRSLEAKGFIRVLSGGGRQTNQYLLTCVDGLPTPDTMSPVTSTSPLTPCPPSGDTMSPQPGHSYVTRTVIEPLKEPVTPSLSERGTHKKIDPDFLDDMTTAFPGIDVQREYAKFNDWRAAKGRRYKDERAAFRNWLRKAEEYAKERNQYGTAGNNRGPIRAIRNEADLDEWDRYKAGRAVGAAPTGRRTP